jgi:hypothetical protein
MLGAEAVNLSNESWTYPLASAPAVLLSDVIEDENLHTSQRSLASTNS